MEDVVYRPLTSPAIAVPPVATVYQRYCPFVPPAAESVIAPAPQVLLPIVVGAVGIKLIMAFTGVLMLSQVPLSMET